MKTSEKFKDFKLEVFSSCALKKDVCSALSLGSRIPHNEQLKKDAAGQEKKSGWTQALRSDFL